jgi:hypothetical protein
LSWELYDLSCLDCTCHFKGKLDRRIICSICMILYFICFMDDVICVWYYIPYDSCSTFWFIACMILTWSRYCLCVF